MINLLIDKIKEQNSPIVVGLDPKVEFLPECVREKAFKDFGHSSKAIGEAFYEFNKGIIDHIYDVVPSVKPQIAMYEQYGIEGLIAYKKTVDYAKSKGLVVIGDIKRGDIASTAEAYAVGHLGQVTIEGNTERGFDSDFITINPYMGYDTIKPFLDVCKEENRGLFVLVKTSNPSSGDFQDLKVGDDFLYERVAMKVDEWGQEHMGQEYSYVGAVVGATYPEVGKRLRELMPKTYFLVPGYGAQGGKAEDMAHYFNKDGLGAIINSSRGIIAAHKNPKYEQFKNEGFAMASRQAVLDMKKELEEALR
ncbi:orotidine-5'-phosphate decarboxylase [Natranaerovirga pectinivora]|uniref:Orotidine 5'-phosphate decarboxylase n=1 Tax=Natranaerovirga pectinivora TaxID=682400 RepID=A0A4R3MJV4_9FIRM|nr:orotidine-5'-phosphate decarboxylase [Natranaerovirga pectinivora]TCT14346.1 orotidine-5'-phosphate decarboxylase [Natranaerovirga pectinivora]